MSTAAEGPDEAEEQEVIRGVASRIRAARLNANLSQNDLAERTGLKRAYVYELERGTANITLKTLTKVAHALFLSPADLLPQSETPRMRRQDIEALFGALDSLVGQIQSNHEMALRHSMEAVQAFRTKLERMLPLAAQGEEQAVSPPGHTAHAEQIEIFSEPKNN